MARTYPGIVSLISIAAGIVTADLIRLSGWIYLVIAVVALVAGAAAMARSGRAATLLFAVVLAGLSAEHFARDTYDPGPRALNRFADGRTRYRLFGRIDDWPDIRSDRIDLTVRIDSLGAGKTNVSSGRLLLKVADTGAPVQYGDRIEFYARLYPIAGGGEGFLNNRSLQLKEIRALAYVRSRDDIRCQARSTLGLVPLVDTIRASLTASLERTLPPRSAALAGGFLMGETRGIPPDLYRAFRDSGTLHLLAVSGSNVALVLGFVMALLSPFRAGRLWRTVLLLAALLLFVLLCRGEPSVMRASVMAALVLLARLVGRPISLNNVVALAAAGILLFAPAQLYSVGFQLSFATAWGLVFITPKVYRLTDRRTFGPVRRWLLLAVIVSLSAQLFSMPIAAYYFQRVPVLTTIANLVIVPLVSVAVIGVLVTLVLDLFWPSLAVLGGTLLDYLMDLILSALRQFSGPRALVLDTGDLPLAAVLLAYTVLIFAGLALVVPYLRRWVVIGGLGLVNAALVYSVVALPAQDPGFEIHVNRVPGGVAAAIIPYGENRADLVITGLTARDYPVADRVLAPWVERLGVTRLRHVVLFAADYDAAAGLVRLADSLQADTIFVHRRLRATMADITSTLSQMPLWRAFADSVVPRSDGLILGDWGALLCRNGTTVAFTRVAGVPTGPLSSPESRSVWLVCGDEVGSTDLIPLRPNLTGVVCAEFAQGEGEGLPVPVIDLRYAGTTTLQLPADSSRSVRIKPRS